MVLFVCDDGGADKEPSHQKIERLTIIWLTLREVRLLIKCSD